MTTAAADGERRGIGPGERIGTITLIKGALARLRAAGLRTVVVWLVITAASYAVQAGFAAVGVQASAPDLGFGGVAYMLVSSAVGGAGVAWALRLLVQGRAAWLRFDRSFLECAGLLAGMTLAFILVSALYRLVAQQFGAASGAAGAAGFAVAIVFLAGAYASLKLALWPVGRLTGRTEVTAGRSWRLMRKATRGLILGYAVLFLPVMVVAGVVMAPIMASGGQPRGLTMVVLQFATAAFSLGAYAMTATIYELRVENPATVADVFD